MNTTMEELCPEDAEPITSTAAIAASASDHVHDMRDSPDDLQRWPRLAPVLEVLSDALLPLYDRADRAATRRLNAHWWLVTVAAVFGVLAVVFAIFELAELPRLGIHLGERLVFYLEFFAACIAGVSVIIGYYVSLPHGWLLSRFQAEQCRHIKFHFLLSPELWLDRTEAERQTALQAATRKVAEFQYPALHEWICGVVKLHTPFGAPPPAVPDELLAELVSYFRVKRLDYQREYFHGQARRRRRWEENTRWIPPACFFASIVFAFSHFVWSLFHIGERLSLNEVAAEELSRWLMLCAAVLPIVGAGVRTFRTAHEFGRNTNRFEALAKELHDIGQELETRSGPETLLSLREAERALDTEHRAWVRLMYEAEWFG